MRPWQIVLALALSAQCVGGAARASDVLPVPTKRQLVGLTPDEAKTLLAKLEDAQRQLKAGKFLPFELLAGSIASYDQTNLSPRSVFLSIPFDKVWNIQRIANATPLRRPFSLAYAPDGLGKPYWDIEVVLGADADLAQVKMTFKPPAPF